MSKQGSNNQGSASVSQTACTITKGEPQESLTLNKLHQPFSSQNQITNWKYPQKLYYSRATYPDILLEEKSNILQNSYNANNIYEWSIDGISEYNILTILQQMTMVATAYRTSHGCTDQLAAHILITGFTGQLKG